MPEMINTWVKIRLKKKNLHKEVPCGVAVKNLGLSLQWLESLLWHDVQSLARELNTC